LMSRILKSTDIKRLYYSQISIETEKLNMRDVSMRGDTSFLSQTQWGMMMISPLNGPLKFHHEFRVTLADCSNAFSQPQRICQNRIKEKCGFAVTSCFVN